MKKYFIFLMVFAFALVLTGAGCPRNSNTGNDVKDKGQVETNKKADSVSTTKKDNGEATGTVGVSKDDLNKLKKDIQSLQVQDINALKN